MFWGHMLLGFWQESGELLSIRRRLSMISGSSEDRSSWEGVIAHQSQHARGLFDGSTASQEAHHHHESPRRDQDVDACGHRDAFASANVKCSVATVTAVSCMTDPGNSCETVKWLSGSSLPCLNHEDKSDGGLHASTSTTCLSFRARPAPRRPRGEGGGRRHPLMVPPWALGTKRSLCCGEEWRLCEDDLAGPALASARPAARETHRTGAQEEQRNSSGHKVGPDGRLRRSEPEQNMKQLRFSDELQLPLRWPRLHFPRYHGNQKLALISTR